MGWRQPVLQVIHAMPRSRTRVTYSQELDPEYYIKLDGRKDDILKSNYL